MGAEVPPELHAEVILKHAQAGAGFISTPGFNCATDKTVAKLRDRAIPEEYPPYPRGYIKFLKAEAAEPPSGIED